MILQPQNLTAVESSTGESQTISSLKADPLNQRARPLADEGYSLGQSQYSSENEDNEYKPIAKIERRDKMERSASSDSALGLDVDDAIDTAQPAVPPTPQQQQRRMTLTVTDLPLRAALLPLAEPTSLPDSPTPDIMLSFPAQHAVSSKLLLEERVVEISDDPRGPVASLGATVQLSSSRRESELSCLSDYPNSECSGVRFVRTPSVVVSDYSDDTMCGITQEELEYFRAQRMCRRRSSLETSGAEKDGELHSDVSAASSCSNLNYCGTTISERDGAECLGNGVRMPSERKTGEFLMGEGSTNDEDMCTIPEQSDHSNDLADLLASQHMGSKSPKQMDLKVPFQLKIERVD